MKGSTIERIFGAPGLVLYEFLSGTNPFKAGNRQKTFNAILSKDLPPCSSFNPKVTPELDRILAKLLAKDAASGYQSASDLRTDLRCVLREMDSSASLSESSLLSSISLKDSNWAKVGAVLAVPVIIAILVLAGWWLIPRDAPVSAPTNEWSLATITQLTDAAGPEYFPSLSPDGKSYVYTAQINGNWDILLQRIGGKNAQNLTADSPGPDTQPAFSPDGESIAFRSDREPKGIYVMGATGENVRRVADFGYHPSWSPDGKELAVSTQGRDLPNVRNSKPSEIWIVNVVTGAKRILTRSDAMQPAWSPDGKLIAYWFMPSASGRRDVAVMPAAGGESVVITTDGNTNWNPVWAPDGRYLYFASDRKGSMSFWRVVLGADLQPASEAESVVTPSKFSRHISFSRDGTRFIYVSTDNKSNIQAVKIDRDSLQPVGEPFWITTGDRQVSRPELSSDGSRFVFRLPKRTQDDIVTVDIDGGNPRDITDDAAFDRYPRWSPDGTQIAFTSDRTGTYEIHTVGADGTGLRRVTFVGGETSFPLWSPDGQRICYSSDGKSYIVDLSSPLETQRPIAIPEPDDLRSRFVAWDWSPDGDKLAGTFLGTPMRVGYYSFGEQRFVSLINSIYYPMWFPDGQRMLFGSSGTISAIDIRTKQVTDIVKIRESDLAGLGVSRAGDLVYYVVNTEESDIWMLDAGPQH